MHQKIWVIIQASIVQGALAKEALIKAAHDLHQRIEVVVIKKDSTIVNFDQPPQKDDVVICVDVAERIRAQYEDMIQTVTTLDAVLQSPQSILSSVMPKAVQIVAVTSCPTGIAHTFMAAEGLQAGAEILGVNIRVETQGSVGSQDALTEEEIKNADIVIIAADREVDRARFHGKRIYASNTKAAINDGRSYIQKALAEAKLHKAEPIENRAAIEVQEDKKIGPYKHLMTGVSFMIPFVVAGGLLIALAFALGGINAGDAENAGTLAHALSTIGGLGFSLMVPALAGYIAFSIADRPGLAPGMIGGLLAAHLGAGFLGGIIAGFLAGYIVLWLNQNIRLSRNLDGLKPVLILPLLATLIVGLIMIYVVGEPIAIVLQALESWLKGMEGANAFVLGAVIGGMMAVDLGGPVNKAAYATSVALISSGVYEPIAAVMAAGMTPPLAAAVATRLFKSKFTNDEYESGVATGVLGLSFISEGAIPFAARDPFRVIPSFVVGSAVAGAISMVLGCELKAPHGGVFVLLIPGAISNLLGYVIAIAAGTVVSAVMLGTLKKRAI